jgi:probable F420-dependent oxidoreductase
VKFAATYLTDPPPGRLVDHARRLERAGFDYVFLNEAQTLFMDPWPVFSQIATATDQIGIGPCVTNPALRDPVVTAALVATLDEISGGRMVCGIGRGDAAPRTLGRKPASIADLDQAIMTIRDLVTGGTTTIDGREVTLRWNPGWPLEMWGAGYGPRSLGVIGGRCDGIIVQAAHPDFIDLAAGFARTGAVAAGRHPSAVGVMAAAPAYVTDDVEHGCHQLRWFVPSVANHVAELAATYDGPLPESMHRLLRDRTDYDYEAKGRVHNPGADYVTPEMTRDFTFVGPPGAHVDKIRRLEAMGVSVVNLYMIHDDVEATIEAYGSDVIPRFR